MRKGVDWKMGGMVRKDEEEGASQWWEMMNKDGRERGYREGKTAGRRRIGR